MPRHFYLGLEKCIQWRFASLSCVYIFTSSVLCFYSLKHNRNHVQCGIIFPFVVFQPDNNNNNNSNNKQQSRISALSSFYLLSFGVYKLFPLLEPCRILKTKGLTTNTQTASHEYSVLCHYTMQPATKKKTRRSNCRHMHFIYFPNSRYLWLQLGYLRACRLDFVIYIYIFSENVCNLLVYFLSVALT